MLPTARRRYDRGVTLACRDACFEFEPPPIGAPVLRGVTLSLTPGRVCVVIGPNGAGKSTLLRLLLGSLTAKSGEVTLDGAAIDRIAPGARAGRVAYIAQRPELAEDLSVREAVSLGRLHRPRDEAAIDDAMQRMELTSLSHRGVRTLSAGQQQRVGVARAIAQLSGTASVTGGKSTVILADEPCSAMDPRFAMLTLSELRREARSGRAVLVVLHDLPLAGRVADDAIVLDETGRAIAQGPASEVLNTDVLRRAFGVEFVELGDGAMGRVLVPRMAAVR